MKKHKKKNNGFVRNNTQSNLNGLGMGNPFDTGLIPLSEQTLLSPEEAAKAAALQRAEVEVIKTKKSSGNSKFDELKEGMSQTHGVDLSGIQAKFDSSFPAQTGADATIQGNQIDFAPGKDTEDVQRHELGHAIDNIKNGAPKADTTVNGMGVNTTREKTADKIGEMPLQKKSVKNSKETQQNGHNIQSDVVQRTILVGKPNGKGSVKYKDAKALFKDMGGIIKGHPVLSEISLDALGRWLSEYETQAGKSGVQFKHPEHLISVLLHNVENMSNPMDVNAPLTVQEEYMTRRGWGRRATGKGALPRDNAEAQLKVYRSMAIEEAIELMQGHFERLGKHLGDFRQASEYFNGWSGMNWQGGSILIEFILKPGAHLEMFRPDQAGLGITGDKLSGGAKGIADWAKRNNLGDHPTVKSSEGTFPDKIGYKSEAQGDSGFSITVGDGNTFRRYVAQIRVVYMDDATKEMMAASNEEVKLEPGLVVAVN